jgi:uncharacterized damage-inducible protein DinB
MDRAAITELSDYLGWAFDRYGRVLDTLPEGRFTEHAPGSGWPALADCFTHIVHGYDLWLNADWSFQTQPVIRPGGERLQSWPEAKAYYHQVRETIRAVFALDDLVLFEHLEVRGALRSRAEVLTDLLLHERGHHGDINTLFYQLGLKPYFNDYSLYLTNPEDFFLDE